MTVELKLRTLTGESMDVVSANKEARARLVIKDHGLWRSSRECSVFDDRVFAPLPLATITSCHWCIGIMRRRRDDNMSGE